MKRVIFAAALLLDVSATVTPALADGGYFPRTASAGALAQTRQEVLMAFYDVSAAADDCADATPLHVGLPWSSYYGTTANASNDGSTDCGSGETDPDVWYAYTPLTDGNLYIQLAWGIGGDAMGGLDFSVYTNCPGDGSAVLTCSERADNDRYYERRWVNLDVIGGTRYLIRVTDLSGGGLEFFLELDGPGAEANEDAVNAVPYVTYVLGSRYVGEPEDFAWVVPIPTTPTDVVAHESRLLFDHLSELTRPRFFLYEADPYQGDGFVDAGGGAAGDEERTNELVEVEAEGQAGIFAWAALTSTGTDALMGWLDANGFAVPPEADRILGRYIEQE